MQSPTSKDKGLIGMPLQIGTPGGIQSENPSCIRVSGNFRASFEHPLRKFQDHLRDVQKLVFRLVPRFQSHLVSRLSCLIMILTDFSEYVESQEYSEYLDAPEYSENPEYPEHPEYPEYPDHP